MNIVETLLIFAGIPLGITAVLVAAVYGPDAMRQKRYKPGKAWEFEPVWFVPHPGHVPGSTSPAAPGSQSGRVGGASGEW
jgi:hypothetical protein